MSARRGRASRRRSRRYSRCRRSCTDGRPVTPARHNKPLARRDRPHAQPDPARLDQLPPPRRGQALLQLPRPLLVVEDRAVAAQEASTADLGTGQATVLGAQLDEPRRDEALLARPGASDPLSIPGSPHRHAMGDLPSKPAHQPARGRGRLRSIHDGQRMSCGEPDAGELARPVRRAEASRPPRASAARRLASDPTTHPYPSSRCRLASSTAVWQLRPGRNPWLLGLNVGSYSGSSTCRTASCTTRSTTLGIPRPRCPPPAFGINARRITPGR